MSERRAEARLVGAALVASDATLRPGHTVRMVDISTRGAQVQSARPLRPGSRVHVRLTVAARTLSIASVVLRCTVWAIRAEEGVLYRGALLFDEPLALVEPGG